MRRVNWREVNPSEGGNFAKLPADGYVVQITGVEDVESREYMKVTFDIADGPYTFFFGKDEFYSDKPYAHQFNASYSQKAEGLFSQFLDCITKSNPGFDAAAAMSAAVPDPNMLVGKYVGIVLREEWYTGKNDGKDKSRFSKLVQYKTTDQILAKDYKVLDPDDQRDDKTHPFGETPAVNTAAAAKVNIPF